MIAWALCDHWGNEMTGCHVTPLSSLISLWSPSHLIFPHWHTNYYSHLLFFPRTLETHSLLYSSEDQSIKNLRPFRRVSKAENLPSERGPGPAALGLSDPIWCWADAKLVQCRLSLSWGDPSQRGLLGLDWMSGRLLTLAAHYPRQQQFKCQFWVKTSRAPAALAALAGRPPLTGWLTRFLLSLLESSEQLLFH